MSQLALMTKPTKSGQTISNEYGPNCRNQFRCPSRQCGQTDITDQTSPNFQISGDAQGILGKQIVKSDQNT